MITASTAKINEFLKIGMNKDNLLNCLTEPYILVSGILVMGQEKGWANRDGLMGHYMRDFGMKTRQMEWED